ncbi:MAG: phosphatidate cytidylyltransferase [Cellvibrionales bacterium]|nr:phosphatidate cytidylyltransferase [Cellvibrionales bacterium]
MLAKRVATAMGFIAVALVAIFLPLLSGSDWPLFALFLLALLVISAWEWIWLAGIARWVGRVGYVVLLGGLFCAVFWFREQLVDLALVLAAVALGFWVLLIPLLVRFPESRPLLRTGWAIAVLGAVILLSTACGLLLLHAHPHGAWLVFCLFTIVTLVDTGGYFVGRHFGRNRVAPQISPAKTWEGLYGGLAANLLFALGLIALLGRDLQQSLLILFTVLLTSLFAVAGDLLESSIKRSQGVKDSGTVLPGHGGLLDRIDGVLAATPCFIFCVLAFSLDFSLG